MEVTASSTGTIPGTAGFGFWNHPFAPGERGINFPRAAWFFFASPANNIRLNQSNPSGHGWIAQTLDTHRLRFGAFLPVAPVAAILMHVPWIYRQTWPLAEWAMRTSATVLDANLLATPHHYTLTWATDSVTFEVDHQVVMQTRRVPNGPMGFVAWCDNQFGVATPQARVGLGVVPIAEPASLILEGLTVTAL
jgi:hypothetical protein